jgi:hypothetical protein
VSCYTRHLGELLPADPSAADKRALDRAIREVLGMVGADCPDVWEEVKARRSETHFVARVEDRKARLLRLPQSPSSQKGGS